MEEVHQANRASQAEPIKRSVGAVFAAIQASFQAGQTYPLVNSAILDSGATIHICNNLHRFKRYPAPAQPRDQVWAGEHPVNIEGYGQVDLKLKTRKGTRFVTLSNVAYCPTFACSVVSLRELNKRGIWWDNRRNILTRADGSELCELSNHYDQFVVEYLPEDVVPAAFAARKRKINSWAARAPSQGDAMTWHLRLGHPGPRVLEHLVGHSLGAKIKGITTVECDGCGLAKAKRLPRRAPRNTHSPEELGPGDRIALDFHEFQPPAQKYRYLLLATDRFSGLVWDYYTETREAQVILASLQHLFKLLSTRFKIVPKVVECDNEFARAAAIRDFCNAQGTQMEPSAPDTPAQNGGAERSGGVIKEKARAMAVGANLPDGLWVEALKAAAYLANRLPKQILDWKSPYERFHTALQGGNSQPKQPDQSHLKVYGCKAYALTRATLKGQERTRRLAPKAWMGVLVGYESSNIYRIWNPVTNEVVRTRDVTFDERQVYSGSWAEVGNELAQLDPAQVAVWFQERLAQKNNPPEDAEDQEMPQESEEVAHQPAVAGHAADTHEDEGVTEGPDEAEEDIQDCIVVRGDHTGDLPEADYYPTPPPTPPEALLAAAFSALQLGAPKPLNSGAGVPTPANSGERGPAPASQEARRSAWRQQPVEPWHAAFHAGTLSSIVEAAKGSQETRAEVARKQAKALRKAARRPRPRKADKTIDKELLAHAKDQGKLPLLHESELPAAPKRHHDLKKHPLAEWFLKAEKEHLESHNTMDSWTEISREDQQARGRQVLDCMWVYTYKFNTQGALARVKARLVVRGDQQRRNFADENYAATLAVRSFRTVLALAARFNLELKQFDAVNAFVNAELDEDIFMEMPTGTRKPGRILRLNKALYGLRKSPLLWQKELTRTLVTLGFKAVPHEPCILVRDGCIIFFYVDDIVVAYRKKDEGTAAAAIEGLRAKYQLTGGEDLRWFLGIEIHRDRKRRLIWLSQTAYLEKIHQLAKPGHPGDPRQSTVAKKTPLTPMAAQELLPYQGTASTKSARLYQRKVGSILYAAVITRPDVAFACSRLARSNQNPGPEHHNAADRVLEYLFATRFLALQLGGGNTLRVASDASFADNSVDRRSSQGFIIILFGGLVAWRANKQDTVTTSTTEAELLSLAQAAKEGMFLQRLLTELTLVLDDPVLTIECDNTNTINLINKETATLQTKLRHVDIYNHWLRQERATGRIRVEYVPTKEMVADGLTKALNADNHQKFVAMLKLVGIKSLIQGQEVQKKGAQAVTTFPSQ